jgi:hypothetical protein
MQDDEVDRGESLLSEELIPVQELPARLPPASSGKRMHRAAVWRWVRDGLKSADGSRVRLEALRMGRRWVTSKQAVGRFFRRLSDARRASDGGAVAAAPATRTDPRSIATLARFGVSVPSSGSSS